MPGFGRLSGILSNEIVMPAHSRSKNGVLSHAYGASIHVLKIAQFKGVDGRDKPGHDNGGWIPRVNLL